MWLCFYCKTPVDNDTSWKDDGGKPIPKTTECERCHKEMVCFWFGPLIKSPRQKRRAC